MIKTMKLGQCFQRGLGCSQLRSGEDFAVFYTKQTHPFRTAKFLQGRKYKSSYW